jgi:hypothetical protein
MMSAKAVITVAQLAWQLENIEAEYGDAPVIAITPDGRIVRFTEIKLHTAESNSNPDFKPWVELIEKQGNI